MEILSSVQFNLSNLNKDIIFLITLRLPGKIAGVVPGKKHLRSLRQTKKLL